LFKENINVYYFNTTMDKMTNNIAIKLNSISFVISNRSETDITGVVREIFEGFTMVVAS